MEIKTITNIAAYLFAPLTDLKPLRERLIAQCKAWGLKGTILLSTEGINLFIAGGREEIELLLDLLREVPGLESLTPKYSYSDHQPFNRMLVRIKKEIIAFGVEGIDPGKRTSPKLSPKKLKQWLDEGREIALLDTRNDYEFKLGTFKNAKLLDINHFRKFPEAIRSLPEEEVQELKSKPLVMFCTGGIRCEKAGPFMEMEGYQNVYQLEGGILKYFEECGGDHYEGECFVFDHRVGVDPALKETSSQICFACQAPLDESDQEDPRYEVGVSCPYCFDARKIKMQDLLQSRRARWEEVTHPLPGSIPMDDKRPLYISSVYDGYKMIDMLCSVFDHIPRETWIEELESGRFTGPKGEVVDAERIVRSGEHYARSLPANLEPDVNSNLDFLYEDEAILVVSKPAPLPMHPGGRYNRNTLRHLLNLVYAPSQIRPAHRLDANTTGLVVCAKSRRFAGKLQPQFSKGTVEKSYLVQVHGHPEWDETTCSIPLSSVPGPLGSREVKEEEDLGKGMADTACTKFKVLARLEDGTSILEANPVTGRTNQIRIHLWKLQFSVVGDPLYLPKDQLGQVNTLALGDAPLRLHSWKIAFDHPLTAERMRFESKNPPWLSPDLNVK